ncbi:YoaK family protein [Bermanella sp. R86510]|uniref:YoaK family protein n=1 Tax=unclassified Bermanella TaxID=2627862 RepID=UPI0037C6CE61
MIKQLPRWVEHGAFLLSLLAGLINAIGFLGFEHQAITHVSGLATQFSLSLASYSPSINLLLILLSFLLGAIISGLLIKHTYFEQHQNYSIPLIIEAILLTMAMFALLQHWDIGYYLASMACGLQNAMVTTFSGAIVRTTHLTGIMTDLGIMLGHALRGKPLDQRKLRVFILIIMGFLSGGVLGVFAFNNMGLWSFAIAILLAASMAIAYHFSIHIKQKAV